MNAQHMVNTITTLLANGNGSHTLDLDRISRWQGFDADDFRAAFLAAETEASLTPTKYETQEAE